MAGSSHNIVGYSPHFRPKSIFFALIKGGLGGFGKFLGFILRVCRHRLVVIRRIVFIAEFFRLFEIVGHDGVEEGISETIRIGFQAVQLHFGELGQYSVGVIHFLTELNNILERMSILGMILVEPFHRTPGDINHDCHDDQKRYPTWPVTQHIHEEIFDHCEKSVDRIH